MNASVKPPLALKSRTLTSKQLSKLNNRLGNQGEQQAADYLQQHGFSVLASNLRNKYGELDLVVLDHEVNEVVFVEVKTRSSGYFGAPSASVGFTKLRAMRRVGQRYLQEHQLENDYRFDIISILPGQIQHFRNVTWK